jgi:hypothetical protein
VALRWHEKYSEKLELKLRKVDLLMKSENYFLLAAFGSFVFSVTLWFLGDADVNKHQAIFVGLWVPSILSLGNLLK